MEITDVRIRNMQNHGVMKAIVSVTFDNSFAVHDMKIIQRDEKTFVAMPSRKIPDGRFLDVAHPINAETREYLQKAVLEKYETSLVEDTEINE